MTVRSNTNPYGLGQIKKSFIHFLFGKGVSALIGVGLLLLTVRALSAESYGVYVALLAAFEIIQLVSNFGLFTAAYRYVPELRASNRFTDLRALICWLSVFRVLTLAIPVAVVALFAQQIIVIFKFTVPKEVIFVYGFVVVAEGLSRYIDIFFDSLLQQKYSQLSLFFRNGLRLLGLLGFIYATNWNVSLENWLYIELVASLVGVMVASVFLWIHIWSLPSDASKGLHKYTYIRRYLTFVGSSYLSQIFGVVYGPETTKLILTKVGGAIQVGAFGFAASLSGMLQRYLPVFLLIGLVRPLFVSVNASENRVMRLNELSNLVLKLNVFVLFPAIAYVLSSGDKLAHLLSGGKFPDSTSYITVFMLLLVFQTWHAVLGLVILAVEDGMAGLHGTLLGLVGLGVGLLLLPNFGSMSLCAGLILSELIWCLYVTYSLANNGIPIKIHWAGIVKILAFSVVGFLVVYWMHGIDFINRYSLVFDAAVISFIFLCLCYRYKPFSNVERSIINKILPRPIFVW